MLLLQLFSSFLLLACSKTRGSGSRLQTEANDPIAYTDHTHWVSFINIKYVVLFKSLILYVLHYRELFKLKQNIKI